MISAQESSRIISTGTEGKSLTPSYKELILTRQVDNVDGKDIKSVHLLITGICNSGCIFCFTRSTLPVEHFKVEMLTGIMKEEYGNGARQLVLSGGEPTIHPEYLSIISLAKSIGYSRIRTITNGRMFRYKSFASQAKECGLHEAVISLHSHKQETQDMLTRVKGSFSQAVEGVKNCLAAGIKTRTNIVVNSCNASELKEMIEHFHQLGIRSFGLLRLMPFGSAWRNKGLLFINQIENQKSLERALEYCQSNGIEVIANRFEFELFSRFPEYRQDYRKIENEVLSRIDEYEKAATEGKPLYCYPERCSYCYLRDFCRSFHDLFLDGKEKSMRPMEFAKQYVSGRYGVRD
jgi:MoaA/NifB/PqqE/SkfB family radical SAM enzyme